MAMSQPMQVLTSQKTDEWYTPVEYIRLVRAVLGTIDLDPASSAVPQSWIGAKRYFTKRENGLNREWAGHVFLNPPFKATSVWVDKAIQEWDSRPVRIEWGKPAMKSSILLVNSNLGYDWFEKLWRRFPVCCLEHRIAFVPKFGAKKGPAKKGSALVLLPDDSEVTQRFSRIFQNSGRIILPA